MSGAAPAPPLAALAPLLDELLAMPVAERAGWVEALGADHAALQPVLRELLSTNGLGEPSHALPDDPLWQAVPAAAQRLLDAQFGRPLQAGDEVGPYRLLQALGEGGMGMVWRAERIDAAPRREVALKLPRQGPQRLRLAERFTRERDILATLVHPHIARLYDAGMAADGQPWLAMELIDGQPITAYVQRNALDLRARVALFLQVLGAVQSAHNHLVVHRDLKPSNILVDADGQVHLLDFGIALLLDAPAGDAALTEDGQALLTPHYASPEQLLRQPLGTASDLYALGVVLCELLCGARPYRPTRDTRGALEEAILAEEPVPPSRAQGLLPAEARRLRGDLDTIVLKALRKDPAERYASADAFAADLQRWLGGEPVLAHPAGLGYRTRKFVWRHRVLVGAASAFALALSAGLGVALWQAGVARHEARRADDAAHTAEQQARTARDERDRAQAVNAFMVSMFEDTGNLPRGVKSVYDLSGRQLLDRAAERLKRDAANRTPGRADLLFTLATMFLENEQPERAVPMMDEAVAIARAAYGERHAVLARYLTWQANLQHLLGASDKAEHALQQALATYRALGDDGSADLAFAYAVQSRLVSARDSELAFDLARKAYALHLRLPEQSRVSTSFDDARTELAQQLSIRGDVASAEPMFRASLDDRLRSQGRSSVYTAVAYGQLGQTLQTMGRLGEAEAALQESVQIYKEVVWDSPAAAALADVRLGAVMHSAGQRRAGREHMANAVAEIQKSLGERSPQTEYARILYARQLLDEGDLDRAGAQLDWLLPRLENGTHSQARLGTALAFLARLRSTQGRHAEALQAGQRAVALMDGPGMARRPGGLEAKFALAQAELAQGQAEASLQRLRDALAGGGPTGLKFSIYTQGLHLHEAQVALAAGDLATAEARCLAVRQAVAASGEAERHGDWLASAALCLGQVHLARHEPERALPELRLAERLQRQWQVPTSPDLAQAQLALGEALAALGDKPAARQWLAQAQRALGHHAQLAERYREPLRRLRLRLA